MGLEILRAPLPFKLAGVTTIATFYDAYAYVQGLGLIVAYIDPVSAAYATGVAQWDGTTFSRAGAYGFSGGTCILDLRNQNALASNQSDGFYNFNYVACVRDKTPFQAAYTSSGAVSVISKDGRYLSFNNSSQVTSSTAGATPIVEYTFEGTPGAALNVSRGRSPTEVCVTFGNGQIRFYDTGSRTQNGGILYVTTAEKPAWFVPKFNVFVQVIDGTVQVLANDVLPHTLSNPAALTDITAGSASVIQVQVLGDAGEPAVGEQIDWTLTAGDGSLFPIQSTTDASGNAQTVYVEPVGGSGTVTIGASLSF